MITKDIVEAALRKVEDPELGHNLVELGLIYNIEIKTPPPDSTLHPSHSTLIVITMTLTTPGCPLGPLFISQIQEVVAAATNLTPEDVKVDITFDPPWSQDAMSDDLKLELGL